MKKQYINLEVIIDAARTDSEIRYNLETEQATIYASTEDDAERGIADLEARGVLFLHEHLSFSPFCPFGQNGAEIRGTADREKTSAPQVQKLETKKASIMP